jgi:hypothetical protein
MVLIDLIFAIIGAFLSAIATIVLIKIFKPKISVLEPSFEDISNYSYLKIPVENNSKKYSANNLQIEAAVILNDQSYHFKLDRDDFIILSKNNSTSNETPYLRIFQAYDVSENTKKMFLNFKTFESLVDLLKENKSYLRVRIHANHEFTGFGRSFETRFKLNQNSFIRIK